MTLDQINPQSPLNIANINPFPDTKIKNQHTQQEHYKEDFENLHSLDNSQQKTHKKHQAQVIEKEVLLPKNGVEKPAIAHTSSSTLEHASKFNFDAIENEDLKYQLEQHAETKTSRPFYFVLANKSEPLSVKDIRIIFDYLKNHALTKEVNFFISELKNDMINNCAEALKTTTTPDLIIFRMINNMISHNKKLDAKESESPLRDSSKPIQGSSSTLNKAEQFNLDAVENQELKQELQTYLNLNLPISLSLEKLKNPLSANDIRVIFDFLNSHPKVSTLRLHSSALSGETAHHLDEMIKTNTSLTSIHFVQ